MRYRKDEMLLLRDLGSGPILRIIDLFLDNPLSGYSQKEVARNLSMSKRIFYKYFGLLEEMGILGVNRTTGRAKLYKINRSNSMVKTITEFERKLSMQTAEREEAK